MFIDFDEYIKYLGDKGISPNQFVLCWMVYHNDTRNMEYYSKKVGGFSRTDVHDLMDRDFILSANPNSDEFDMSQLVVTPKFSESIIIEPEQAFEEVQKAYIDYFMINGNKVSSTSCDLYALERFYAEVIIKGNKLKHDHIVRLTKIVAKMMKEKRLTPMKIDKYLKGKNWRFGESSRDDYKTDLW